MKYTSIVISGLPVSGKSTLTERLHDLYGWPVYSIGDHYRKRWKDLYPAGDVPFEQYWRGVSLDENAQINDWMKRKVQNGFMIGDSRYSVYCRDLPSLLVFLTADMETRIYRSGRKYPEKSEADVFQILNERENDERVMGEKLFHIDYRDPRHYHLVLNSGMLSVDSEVSVIGSLLSKSI